MERILEYFSYPYYTSAVALLLAIVGLIITIGKRSKTLKLKPLSLFFIAYLFGQLIALILQYITPKKGTFFSQIFYYSDFAVTVIEFLVFYVYIKSNIYSPQRKKMANPLGKIFLLYSLCYFGFYLYSYEEFDQYFLQSFFTTENIFLIGACTLYYLDVFSNLSISNLLEQPSFWVITGICFFSLCTLPFSFWGEYLLNTHLVLYRQLFAIYEIFYCILFLMIIKACYAK